MAKERKTAYELEVLIFNEARKARECEGMTRTYLKITGCCRSAIKVE